MAEIIVTGCSHVHVLLGVMTTGKPDSYCYNGSCPFKLKKKSVRLYRLDKNARRAGCWRYVGHPCIIGIETNAAANNDDNQ